ISGRYTTSNAVHQTSKLPPEMWQGFLDWLYELEYNKVGIPKPDKVIFLDMPVEVSQKLLSHRYAGNEDKKDIHESDTNYLDNCRKAAMFTAQYSGWTVIPCAKNGQARSIEDISNDILSETLKLF
ncbi:MAG: dTMP kinase, partial [Acutalibacteraceae bacterium]